MPEAFACGHSRAPENMLRQRYCRACYNAANARCAREQYEAARNNRQEIK